MIKECLYCKYLVLIPCEKKEPIRVIDIERISESEAKFGWIRLG